MSVKENLLNIQQTLPPHVTLVAVSKTKPAALILDAYGAGQRDFGENYVQELATKQEQLPKDIRWHFIGHLQSNKIKYILPFVHLVQGVDSPKLLMEINKQALKHGRVVNCLLQVHIASEETKFGFSFGECEAFLASGALEGLQGINVRGFMGMASNTADEEQVRGEFRALKQFRDKVAVAGQRFEILSYGMSGDYLLAVEEGSTMVRIGSTIFGERNYSD